MKAASIALGEGNLGQVASLLDRYVPQPGEEDIRGMEWRYLRRISRSDELFSCFQDGIVTHVLLAPGETWAVSGCHQGAVNVWDLRGGKLIRSLDAMKGSGGRSCLALSPDGRLLLRVRDATVDLLDTSTWQVVRAIEGKAVSAAFSRDGARWARVLEDGVHVHESAGPTEIQHLTRPGFKPSQGGLVLDGRKLCLLSPTRRVEVWDLEEARCVSEGLGPNDVHTIALAPGGHRLAAGMSNGNLSLLDLDGLREIARIPAHPQWLLALAFSPDGKVLATGGGDQCIRLWNVEKDPPDLGKPLGILRGHLNEIWCFSFSANGERLLSGGKDGAMKLWSARAPEPRSRVLECAPGSLACGFSADGSYFRSLSTSQSFELWRSSDGARAEGFPRPESAVDVKTRRGEWPFLSGDHLFLSLASGDVEIWNLPRSERLRSIRLEPGPVEPVAVDREERSLLGWSHQAKSAGIWSLETGRRLAELPNFWFQSAASPPAVRAAFSPDGRWLAYVSPGIAVEIYDVEHRVIHHELKAHLLAIYSLAFSPDGKLLATSGGDGSVILWDWVSGQKARPPLLGHLAGVLQVTFSGDGRTLISHTGDGSLRCWNVATGTEVLHLPDASSFWSPPISPDGKTLVWKQLSTGKYHMMRLE